MRVRFLADANLDQDIVAGVIRRQPEVDFELPQGLIPEGMKDPEVLTLAASLGRILVTHDVRTMPRHFGEFEDLLLIWQVSETQEWVNLFRRLPL